MPPPTGVWQTKADAARAADVVRQRWRRPGAHVTGARPSTWPMGAGDCRGTFPARRTQRGGIPGERPIGCSPEGEWRATGDAAAEARAWSDGLAPDSLTPAL